MSHTLFAHLLELGRARLPHHTIICSRLPWHTLHDAVKHPIQPNTRNKYYQIHHEKFNSALTLCVSRVCAVVLQRRRCWWHSERRSCGFSFIFFHRISQVVRIIIILCAYRTQVPYRNWFSMWYKCHFRVPSTDLCRFTHCTQLRHTEKWENV